MESTTNKQTTIQWISNYTNIKETKMCVCVCVHHFCRVELIFPICIFVSVGKTQNRLICHICYVMCHQTRIINNFVLEKCYSQKLERRKVSRSKQNINCIWRYANYLRSYKYKHFIYTLLPLLDKKKWRASVKRLMEITCNCSCTNIRIVSDHSPAY